MSEEEFDDGYYDEEWEREKFDTYVRPPIRNQFQCHNYQPTCEHKDCNTCGDWWYNEAEHGRFAEKGR